MAHIKDSIWLRALWARLGPDVDRHGRALRAVDETRALLLEIATALGQMKKDDPVWTMSAHTRDRLIEKIWKVLRP
jgi:hypothetical protein